MSDSFTIVVPAHEPSEQLRHCLRALAACDPPPWNVILVLDGDGWPKERPDFVNRSIEIVPLGAKRGAAAARNEGWRRASTSWVVFVDSDVAVPEDFPRRIEAAIRHEPRPDAFFGSYDSKPRASGLFSRYRNLLHHFTHQNGNEDASTFWAGCGAVKREALLAVNGFDETFHASSIEDIELGLRLRRQGFRIRLEKSLQVTHLKQWHLEDIWFTDVHRRALPWARLLIQTGEASNDLNLSRAGRLSGLLAVTGTLLASLSGLWPALGLVGLGALTLMALLNARFYALLFRTGGPSSLVSGVFFHYLYYLTSSLAYGFAVVENRLRPGRRGHGAL